jgi:predicted ATPase/class 3 adenylate cyclase
MSLPTRPTGTVTFLFTDIEGSTKLLQVLGDGYLQALAEHRRVLRDVFAAHSGFEVDTQGDAFFYAFAGAKTAVKAAAEAQRALLAGSVRVRMGLHTGDPLLTDEGYAGMDVHRAARIAAAGHGGQVLLSEPTKRLLDDSIAVRDLGLHRLKDLQAAERIYQLGDNAFPPLRTLNQTNLPVQPTPFLGRQLELAEVLGIARRDDVRMLTLTGPGGSGKTRLALQAAAELIDEHRDGVWFVSAAALTDPGLLIGTIARALGLREDSGETSEQALDRHLQAKQALLVIDNVEHLLPTAAATLGQLSSAFPQLTLVVTSREPLRLGAEHEYPVSSLLIDEAVVLFVERTQAHRPAFELLASTRPTVEAICARVDRLPLAVELAAAWMKLLAADKLLERLDQRLPLLVGGMRDAPERQRTLRATIGWSYQLLTEPEQQLLACLAVFSGGCELAAAEEVCGSNLEMLASLVDKSLLRVEERAGAELRYTMLETIREFARERLEQSGEAEVFERRRALYFLQLVERADPELKRSQQGIWLARLEAEHDNLRGSLEWALGHGESEAALRMSAALWMFWYMRGYVSEGRRWLSRALAVADRAATEARAKALDGAGYLASEQGAFDDALSLLRESLACARENGSPDAVATAATHLSVYVVEDDLVGSLALGEEAVAAARLAGDQYTLAVAYNNLGEVARVAGDNARATAVYEQSYLLRKELGDTSRLALSLVNLGEMALIAGDVDRAAALFSEGLELARPIGDKRHVAFALLDLGWVALAQQRYDESRGRLREALALSREIGNRTYVVDVLLAFAGLAAAQGRALTGARLAGAAQAHQAPFRFPSCADAGIHERHLEAARASCDDEAWAAAWRDGGAMDLDQAMDDALSVPI